MLVNLEKFARARTSILTVTCSPAAIRRLWHFGSVCSKVPHEAAPCARGSASCGHQATHLGRLFWPKLHFYVAMRGVQQHFALCRWLQIVNLAHRCGLQMSDLSTLLRFVAVSAEALIPI